MSENSSTPAMPLPVRSWGDFITSTGVLVAFVFLSLAVIFAFLPEVSMTADVRYYWAWLELLPQVGFTKVLAEYPLPAAVLLAIPAIVSGDANDYLLTYVAGMFAVISLWFAVINHYLPQARTARVLWAILIVAMGPMVVLRFDLLPALCVGLGLTLLAVGAQRGSGWLAHLIAWGTGLKLWPAALLALLAGRKMWRRDLGIYAASGVVFVLVSAILGGWSRVFSPLGWQEERGLHCESVLASWITAARIFTPQRWQAQMSPNNSLDLSGPGVASTLTVGTVLLLLTVLAVGMAAWRLRQRRHLSGEVDVHVLALTATAIIATLIVTNKVFSPQYMMWLLPVWVVAVGTWPQSHNGRSWLGLSVALVVITAITQLVFPTLYAGMFWYPTPTTFTICSLLLIARNLALVIWTGVVWRRWWMATATGAVVETDATAPDTDADSVEAKAR